MTTHVTRHTVMSLVALFCHVLSLSHDVALSHLVDRYDKHRQLRRELAMETDSQERSLLRQDIKRKVAQINRLELSLGLPLTPQEEQQDC